MRSPKQPPFAHRSSNGFKTERPVYYRGLRDRKLELSHKMKSRFITSLGVLTLLALTSVAAPVWAGKRKPYAQGETVTLTGTVTNARAVPLAEVEVVLKAARHSYDYLRFRKRTPVGREVRTETSSDGTFEIEWPWDRGFNRFVLFFGLTVAEAGDEVFHVLHEEDMSRRITLGSPVVTTVQIADTAFLESFLAFREGLETEAQRETYRQAGKPDKVRERVFPTHNEVDWWYFGLGKVYRFRDGELVEVETFEPVEPFDS